MITCKSFRSSSILSHLRSYIKVLSFRVPFQFQFLQSPYTCTDGKISKIFTPVPVWRGIFISLYLNIIITKVSLTLSKLSFKSKAASGRHLACYYWVNFTNPLTQSTNVLAHCIFCKGANHVHQQNWSKLKLCPIFILYNRKISINPLAQKLLI